MNNKNNKKEDTNSTKKWIQIFNVNDNVSTWLGKNRLKKKTFN